MKLINKKALILICGMMVLPFVSHSQEVVFPTNQKGYWVKSGNGIGLANLTPGTAHLVDAASSNSIVSIRRKKIDSERYVTIHKFTNEGKSWEIIYKKKANYLVSGQGIAHPTKDVVGMLIHEGYGNNSLPSFLYSTNGGETFNTLHHQKGGGMIKGEKAINISMYNEKHWAFVTFEEHSLKHYTYLFITHDGGKTWQEKQFNVDHKKNGKYQVVMRSPDKISLFPKAVGDAKTRISTDGGKTWQTFSEMPDDAKGWLEIVEFPSPSIGYVGGVDFSDVLREPDTGKVYKTTDGGRSWQLVLDAQLPFPAGGISEIDCINENECLAQGGMPNILRTRDGGDSWLKDSLAFSNTYSLSSVYLNQNGDRFAFGVADGRNEFFRFKRTDTTSSTTTEEKVKSHEQSLAIYPNPSDGRLQIRWEGKNAVTGKLYNMQGQVVHHFNLTPGQQETYSLSGIKPGTYVFKVNGRDITKKVLIQGQAD